MILPSSIIRPPGNRLPRLVLAALLVAPALAAAADGRVAAGKALATDRARGNCLACHMMDDGELPGDLGPPLLAMKLRFPEREALKKQVCDATLRNPDSRMPPFCRHGILTKDEVDLIVDYLYTL
jgi:sulfur-oxidizing protein SoxX